MSEATEIVTVEEAMAEVERIRQEYADFRANVVKVGQEEAVNRGWCDEWRDIISTKLGIQPSELPPTHAKVTVMIGDLPVKMKVALRSDGTVSVSAVYSALMDEIRYGATQSKIRRSDTWFKAEPIVYDSDSDSDDDDDDDNG